MHFFRTWILLIAVLATGSTVAAQTGASDSDANTPEKPGPAQGPKTEITVTATRTPTPLGQVGQSVTIITAEDIEAQGARSVLQVLETVPGFNVVRSGSFGGAASVFVRGGESDFNLVLIDGVPANQPGGAFDFGDITTANVEKIEIVRGPSSVLYGADAASSVINIITRQGKGRPSGSFGFEGGSYDSYLFRGGFSGGSKRVRYSLGTQWSRSDGIYAFNNDYRRGELSASTSFAVNRSSVLTGNLRFLDSTYAFPTNFAGTVVDPNDFRTTEETHYTVAYENQFTRRYDSRIQYGYHRRDFQNFTREDGRDDFFDSTFEADENRNFLDWQNNLNLSENHLLTAGIGYEREESDSGRLARRSLGLYVQDQMSWRDRFYVTVGARYDDNDSFESFASGNLSLAYRLSREVKLRGSVGNGFRAPAFTEIIGFPEFGIAGNPNLNPEKNLAFDLGVDYRRTGGQAGVTATLFFNRFTDLIEFTFLVPAGAPNYLNLEAARSRGVELEGFFKARPELRIGGQYTFTDTEVTNAGSVAGGAFEAGQGLLRRPRHQAALFGEFIKRRYRLRLDLKFKGKRDDVQFFPDFSSARVKLDSYWKADFGITVPLIGLPDSRGDLAVVLRGENIFDRQYTEVAGFVSPGRSFLGGLEVAF